MLIRRLVLLAALLSVPGCTTRQVALEELAAPAVTSGITPLTVEQDAQIAQ